MFYPPSGQGFMKKQPLIKSWPIIHDREFSLGNEQIFYLLGKAALYTLEENSGNDILVGEIIDIFTRTISDWPGRHRSQAKDMASSLVAE